MLCGSAPPARLDRLTPLFSFPNGNENAAEHKTVLCTLIRQHYSMRSEDIKETAFLHGKLLDAIIQKDEIAVQALAKQILTQGITVLQERYD